MHRLIITRQTITQDLKSGQELAVWTNLATVWGDVRGLNVDESTGEKQEKVIAQYEITMRYYAGLLHTDRIIHDGQTLAITSSPVEDGKKRQWVFQAKEVQ